MRRALLTGFIFPFITALAAGDAARGSEASLYCVPVAGNTGTIISEKSSRFTLVSSDAEFSLPGTPFQKTTRPLTHRGATRIDVYTGTAGNTSPPGDGLTSNTRFLNLDAPEIRAAAARLSASPDPVASVERFVEGHITHKIVGIPIVTAKDVYRTRSGDCTEHAVLSIALLRSMKIPSRAVVGMIFVQEYEGLKNTFVFHMWAECYYKGRWVLVDATRPWDKHPNRYIAFSYHHLKTEMPLSYLRAVTAIKNLRVEYAGR
jgi:hypothetical protein